MKKILLAVAAASMISQAWGYETVQSAGSLIQLLQAVDAIKEAHNLASCPIRSSSSSPSSSSSSSSSKVSPSSSSPSSSSVSSSSSSSSSSCHSPSRCHRRKPNPCCCPGLLSGTLILTAGPDEFDGPVVWENAIEGCENDWCLRNISTTGTFVAEQCGLYLFALLPIAGGPIPSISLNDNIIDLTPFVVFDTLVYYRILRIEEDDALFFDYSSPTALFALFGVVVHLNEARE